jgi:stearoyl-CoA desaturase (delta-9 desaturase)
MELQATQNERINWWKSTAFFLMHLAPFAVFLTGITVSDVLLCIALYLVRMFFVTAGYHRYFAHRSYKMGRVMQFVMAFGASTAAQKGVLWWAGYHRHHHLYSDQPKDIHSPVRGFWWSHVGWILCDKYKPTPTELIQDFAKYPELRFLNRFHLLPPTLLGASVLVLGGPSALVVGFFLSTVLLYHGTFVINSLTHIIGRRRYVTQDSSRNSLVLALLTLGEGWHNNHHYYRSATKQGFFWWEIDVTYYVLKLLSWFGLVWDLRAPPRQLLRVGRVKDGLFDVGVFQVHRERALRAIERLRGKSGAYVERKRARLQRFIEATHEKAEEIARQTSGHPSF